MSSKRGGKREGAGRPMLGPSPLKQVTVRLPEETIAQIKAIGGGNFSEGVRILLATQMAIHPR